MKKSKSGTRGLGKKHNPDCTNRGDLTKCSCAWRGRRGTKEVVLATWAKEAIDPRSKTKAQDVLRRFVTAVDSDKFDPTGERPALGTKGTLEELIAEYKIRYVEEYKLTSNSLDATLNLLSESRLGGLTLKHLAGNHGEIFDWLNAKQKEKGWTNKTWEEYRLLLSRVFKYGITAEKLTVNPCEKITAKVFFQPDHFKQRHFDEAIEDRMFEVVDLLNRPVWRPTTNKLTLEQAQAIRGKLALGQIGAALAKEYRISAAVVSAIKHGDIWQPHQKQTTKGSEMRRRLVGAYYGGLRAGEMQRIQLAHVTWKLMVFEGEDGALVEAYEIRLPPQITKGGKSTGEIEYIYAATPEFRQLLEARRFQLGKHPPARQFIFGTEEGREQKSFKKMWHKLFALALGEAAVFGRNVGIVWHTIRHEFCNRIAEQTKDPVLAQKLMRHKDLATTQLYFHTRRDREVRAFAGLARKRA